MHIIGLILVIAFCLIICYQDFTKRLIHIGNIAGLAIGIYLSKNEDNQAVFQNGIYNVIFLLFLFTILYIYFYLRTKDKKFFNHKMGWGDIIILFVFCFSYNLYNFVLFIMFSSILSLIFWLINYSINKKKEIKIPFASFLTIFHLIVTAYCHYSLFDPVRDIVL